MHSCARRRGAKRQSGAPLLLFMLAACTSVGRPVDAIKVKEFATRYTAAWCSQNPARVASFFAPGGSLTINGGVPATGRPAITAAAQEFMTAFPDLRISMDGVTVEGHQAIYRWTLAGTNTGLGGSGRAVRISGYEEWTLGADGLIAKSLGHFDAADYQRQLSGGAAHP
jgi:uncharacterized protein (TIGR02246 family)